MSLASSWRNREEASSLRVEDNEDLATGLEVPSVSGSDDADFVSPDVHPWIAFFIIFFATKGAPQMLAIGILLAVGFSVTVGVVPGVISDRYARLHYEYDGVDCSEYARVDKPDACQLGADKAQSSAALAVLAMNLLALGANSTVGSISDGRGRKRIMVLCMFLWTLAPFVLVILQLHPSMDPIWYFVAYAPIGIVNFMSIVFAILSDLMPSNYRAPSFGLFLGSYYFGASIGPSFARLLDDHFRASVLSLLLFSAGTVFTVLALPETLPKTIADRNLAAHKAEAMDHGRHPLVYTLLRPFRETLILNRDSFLRLLTTGAFFSGMVYSSDASLVHYYIADQLDFRDRDFAWSYLLGGLLGAVIQGGLLQILIAWLGDKGLLVASFACGTLHNFLYGVAKNKGTIYVAICLSQFTKTNFPVTSSLASTRVNADEQGRIQGALFSVSALADAVGPVLLQQIYKRTKDGSLLGPGTMFVFAAILYAIGTVIVSCIPIQAETEYFVPADVEPDETPAVGGGSRVDGTGNDNEEFIQMGSLT